MKQHGVSYVNTEMKLKVKKHYSGESLLYIISSMVFIYQMILQKHKKAKIVYKGYNPKYA